MTDQPQPTELRVSKDKKLLSISFKSGETFDLEAELLRVRSPSAEVQGHSPDQRVLISGKSNIEIMKLEPVGNYAIRITFDDMHNTGIFSWAFMHGLGVNKTQEWADYEAELKDAGKVREPIKLG